MTREQIKGNHVLGMESASSRMNALGRRMLLMGNTQTEDQMLERLNAVTLDEVNEVVREILSGDCSAALVGRGADELDLSAFGL
jgi:predicted Zn-dependent peptidase